MAYIEVHEQYPIYGQDWCACGTAPSGRRISLSPPVRLFLRDEKEQSQRSCWNKFSNVMTFLEAEDPCRVFDGSRIFSTELPEVLPGGHRAKRPAEVRRIKGARNSWARGKK